MTGGGGGPQQPDSSLKSMVAPFCIHSVFPWGPGHPMEDFSGDGRKARSALEGEDSAAPLLGGELSVVTGVPPPGRPGRDCSLS